MRCGESGKSKLPSATEVLDENGNQISEPRVYRGRIHLTNIDVIFHNYNIGLNFQLTEYIVFLRVNFIHYKGTILLYYWDVSKPSFLRRRN